MVLCDRGRISYLADILEKALEIAYKKASIEVAYVISSNQLTASQEEALILKLQAMSGAKQIKLKLTVDEALIGGFIVQVGSKIIDSSIRGQLRQLASYLGASIV
jgi:F-type H+-transporting ATPase subunit delta